MPEDVSSQPESPPNQPESLEQKIETMKREIDALQITVMSQKKPWYREVPVMVSVIALLFSFGTTFVSYQRTQIQDVQSRHQELRVLLQRLAALPKENLEAIKKYATDPASLYQVQGYINQENEMLTRQAAEIAKKLPKDTVSSTEYFSIGLASGSSYDFKTEREFLQLSEQTAQDFNAKVGALRTLANLDFITGQPGEGRVEYQKTLSEISNFKVDSFTTASLLVYTELAWAASEYSMGTRAAATQHLDNADRLVTTVQPGPSTDLLRSAVAQAHTMYQAGIVPANPSAGAPQLSSTTAKAP